MAMIQSPCINICEMDKGTGLCRGCARTLQEIANWSQMTEAERQMVMADIPARKEWMARPY